MNEKELLDVFNNDKFINKLLESGMDKDYFVTDCNPIFTLKEALEALDEHILDFICDSHKIIVKKDIVDTNDKKEKIKNLEESILTSFKEFIRYLTKNDKKIIEDVIKNTYTKKMDVNLLNIGYLFAYKQNHKNVFVVPNELLEIYKTYQNSSERIKNEYQRANMYIITYMLMNGVLEKKFVEDLLIKEYDLNITKEHVSEILKKHFFNYGDEYYAPIENGEENIGLEASITIKKNIKIKYWMKKN